MAKRVTKKQAPLDSRYVTKVDLTHIMNVHLKYLHPIEKTTPSALSDMYNMTDIVDNVMHALRLMPSISCERHSDISAEFKVAYRNKTSVFVDIKESRVLVQFNRRDGKLVHEEYTNFTRATANLASILMFYALR